MSITQEEKIFLRELDKSPGCELFALKFLHIFLSGNSGQEKGKNKQQTHPKHTVR
jgi:hypothetical protein